MKSLNIGLNYILITTSKYRLNKNFGVSLPGRWRRNEKPSVRPLISNHLAWLAHQVSNYLQGNTKPSSFFCSGGKIWLF